MTTSTLCPDQQLCEQRGCCWSPLDERQAPWCFFSINHGYTVVSSEQPNDYGESQLPSLPAVLSHSERRTRWTCHYLAHLLHEMAPCHFSLCRPFCTSFKENNSFSLSPPAALFSVKCDMDGISGNTIDFAACRAFPFSAWFHCFRRAIGHLSLDFSTTLFA